MNYFQIKINSASFGDFGAIRWEKYFYFKVREFICLHDYLNWSFIFVVNDVPNDY